MQLGYVTANGLTANGSYPVTNDPQAVKALGLLQRAEGLASGLEELVSRLEGVTGRVLGHGSQVGEAKSAGKPIGIPANLSEAEGHLRKCFQILDAFNEQW